MIIINYLKACSDELSIFLFISIILAIYSIYKKENMKVFIGVVLFMSIFHISDFWFYKEYLSNPTQKAYVKIEKIEKETLIPYSEFITKGSSKYCTVFMIHTNDKNRYLLANQNWENEFEYGYPISGEVEIHYKETHRYDIITHIKKK